MWVMFGGRNPIHLKSRKRKIGLTQDWGNIPEKKKRVQGKNEENPIFYGGGGRTNSTGEQQGTGQEGEGIEGYMLGIDKVG